MISEEALANCRQEENKWLCPLSSCGKVLSRKQTLKTHVVTSHNLKCAIPVKQYKQYEHDPTAAIPRTTMYNKKRKLESGQEELLQRDPHVAEVSSADIHRAGSTASLENIDMDIVEDTNAILNDTAEPGLENTELTSTEETSDNSVPLYVVKCDKCPEGLYSSSISQKEHELAVLAFASRHNLSDTALEDLLALVSLYLPLNNLVETDVNKLKGRCGFDSKFLKNFVFCNVCESTIPSDSDLCTTPNCQGQKPANRNKSFFMTANIKSQLCEILEKDGVWDAVRERSESSASVITDIVDGEAYRELKLEGGFLSNKDNITVTLFTDGTPLFKSSGVSLWPVYLLVNELPRHERFKKKNMVLWGVWQGTGKPAMTVYLKELVIDLQDLYRDGISFNYGGEVIQSRVLLIVATMDLQARAAVLKMTQHNGEFACVFCLIKGKQVKTGKGHCKVFPHSENLELRSNDDIKEDSHEAHILKKKVRGFTGESALLYAPQFELNRNIVVDYMHGILLGIVKKLMTLWFDNSNSKQPYYIGNKVKDIDKSLTNITPPYSISRLPRKIQNTMHHWKASELRAWLLFYSLPCLHGKLPDVYLKHFSLLVEATFSLLSEGIDGTDLERADLLLKTFCRTAPTLYQESIMGLNMHNLRHLTSCVRKWGPLWAWSCFCFESFNGEIKKTIHGTGNVCIQIFWALLAQKHIEHASSAVLSENVSAFIRSQTGTTAYSRENTVAPCIVKKTFQLPDNFEFPCEIKTNLQSLTGKSDSASFSKAKRIIVSGRSVWSKNQSKVKKRNSYTVIIVDSLSNKRVLEIDYFVVDKATSYVYAIGKHLTEDGSLLPGNASHIQKRKYSSMVQTVEKAKDIQEVVVSFEVNAVRFISRVPNTLEGD